MWLDLPRMRAELEERYPNHRIELTQRWTDDLAYPELHVSVTREGLTEGMVLSELATLRFPEGAVDAAVRTMSRSLDYTISTIVSATTTRVPVVAEEGPGLTLERIREAVRQLDEAVAPPDDMERLTRQVMAQEMARQLDQQMLDIAHVRNEETDRERDNRIWQEEMDAAQLRADLDQLPQRTVVDRPRRRVNTTWVWDPETAVTFAHPPKARGPKTDDGWQLAEGWTTVEPR